MAQATRTLLLSSFSSFFVDPPRPLYCRRTDDHRKYGIKMDDDPSAAETIASLHRRVNELEAAMVAMQKVFLAQERAAMGMADVASDVRVMRKEQDSHRYDLRLLKASVGDLISADRAYALELEHAQHRLESSMSRASGPGGPSGGGSFDRGQMMGEIMQAMESRMDKMVEEKVRVRLGNERAGMQVMMEAASRETHQAKQANAWSASELNHHYANGTALPQHNTLFSADAARRDVVDDDERQLVALRQEYLKSQQVAERAQGIQNEAISDATRSLEADLARLEKNMLGASRDLNHVSRGTRCE